MCYQISSYSTRDVLNNRHQMCQVSTPDVLDTACAPGMYAQGLPQLCPGSTTDTIMFSANNANVIIV